MILQGANEKGFNEWVTKTKAEKSGIYFLTEVPHDFNGTSGNEIDLKARRSFLEE
jgi:hypothetical protein